MGRNAITDRRVAAIIEAGIAVTKRDGSAAASTMADVIDWPCRPFFAEYHSTNVTEQQRFMAQFKRKPDRRRTRE
jgi:hypothetical protein